jgi:sterol 3beta-glucosyltransferase
VCAETGLSACKSMNKIVAGIGGLFVGFSLAEKFDIPFFQAYYIPFTPTRGFPSFLFPKLPQGFSGVLNRLSYHIMRQMIWQSFRSTDKLTRKKVRNLSGPSFWGPFKSRRLNQNPIFYGFCPSVIPPPTDWGNNTIVTGYW